MATRVSVFGLGYVGTVSAACLANAGHDVTGVDVNPDKVAAINAGVSPVLEEGVGELVAEMTRRGLLRATTAAAEAVRESSISLICVDTPSLASGSLDLRAVQAACADVGGALRSKTTWHTVVIRSTVLPTTIECVIVPLLAEASGRAAGEDFGVAMNPAFFRQGSSVGDFTSPPFTVIGTTHERAAAALTHLYAGVRAPLLVVEPRVAELLNYTANCFEALTATFANEIGNVCKGLGVDAQEVMRLFCMDTTVNASPGSLRPGAAFGGPYLVKDLRAVVHRARQLEVDTPVLNAVLESNRRQVNRAYDLVAASGARRVGVLGLSGTAGTADLRDSPNVSLVEMLHGHGMRVAIYDRDVSRARLLGANKDYVDREVPHIWSMMRPSIAEVLEESDVVVIGNASDEFRDIAPRLRRGQQVVDLVRAFGDRVSDRNGYQGICW
jgi:GDP-mannose 6-dehydrogenase